MKMARTALLVLLAAAAPPGAAEDEDDEKAPEFVIQGATLDLRWAGATIQAPSIHWKWTRAVEIDPRRLDAFQCVNGMNEHDAYFVLVSRKPAKPLDASGMDDLVNTIRKSGPGEGWVLASPEHEPSDIPWPGSYRLRYRLTSAFATAYLHAYAGRKTRAYLTLCFTLTPEEPPEFARFSRSLSVREEKKGRMKGVLTGLALLVVTIGVIQWLRSR